MKTLSSLMAYDSTSLLENLLHGSHYYLHNFFSLVIHQKKTTTRLNLWSYLSHDTFIQLFSSIFYRVRFSETKKFWDEG